MSKENKIYYIENLRVLACFLVILCHVASMNWYGYIDTNRWVVFTIYTALSKCCVPIFVMISGALFLRKDKELDIKRLYQHNIFKLIIFLLFWTICYQIYHLVNREGMHASIFGKAVMNVLKGQTQVHFWYIFMIIGLYMIAPVLKQWIKYASKKQIEYFLVLFLLFQCVYTTITNVNIEIFQVISDYSRRLSVNMVSGYVGYFVLGYYLNEYELTEKKRKICYGIGIVGIICCILLTVIMSRRMNQPTEIFWNYCTVFMAFWSMAVFVFFKNHLSHYKNKFVSEVSKCCLGIYGFHMFVILELWKHELTTFSFCAVVSVPVITIVTFAVSFIVVKLLSYIPFGNKWIL